MKSLIKPTIVMSFMLVLAGLVPSVQWYMPVLGLVSMLAASVAGVFLIGSEDREYSSQLELIRIERLAAKTDYDKHVAKYNELEARISRAISENREIAGRLQ